MDAGGIVVELNDLQQLTELSADDLARLKAAEVVGVRQGEQVFITGDPRPSPGGTDGLRRGCS